MESENLCCAADGLWRRKPGIEYCPCSQRARNIDKFAPRSVTAMPMVFQFTVTEPAGVCSLGSRAMDHWMSASGDQLLVIFGPI